MTDKLTQSQRDVLSLILRSPDRGDRWRTCSPTIFDKLISDMPDALVEKDAERLRVRLTREAETILFWT